MFVVFFFFLEVFVYLTYTIQYNTRHNSHFNNYAYNNYYYTFGILVHPNEVENGMDWDHMNDWD